jgi:hypothetical protein
MYVCAVAIDIGEKGISIEEDHVPAGKKNTCTILLSLSRYHSLLVAAVV